MIRIGVMGSIGSGKSFVAKLFNYPVFNADNEVKHLYKNSKECFKKLKNKLPKHVNKFPIRKKDLISAIHEDKNNLNKISSIVQPLVRKKMYSFIKKNKKRRIIVLDIPLLIENKLNNKNDVLIFVKSKKNKILSRLKKRRAYNKKLLKYLRENQIMLSKKRKLANYIVDNNFSQNIMKRNINLLKDKILNERSSS